MEPSGAGPADHPAHEPYSRETAPGRVRNARLVLHLQARLNRQTGRRDPEHPPALNLHAHAGIKPFEHPHRSLFNNRARKQ